MQVSCQIFIGQQIGVAFAAHLGAKPGIGAREAVARALGRTGGGVKDGGVAPHDWAGIGGHGNAAVVGAVGRITQIGADALDLHHRRCDCHGVDGGRG